MEHHGGLFADISNSFPGAGGLPSTNVKYHLHNPPQPIPPQPPPPPGPSLGPLAGRQYHQYHHSHPQQQQQQQQHQLSTHQHSHSQQSSSGASQPAVAVQSSVVVGAYGQSILQQHPVPQTPGIIRQGHGVQQQPQQQPDGASQQQHQQQHHHHLESLHPTINGAGNLFPDTHTVGLYGDTVAHAGQGGNSSATGSQSSNTTTSTSGSSSSTSSSYSSSISNSSRKFETNTGDSITYNINNINTNIVNNISSGQGAPATIAAISNGACGTVDFLGGGGVTAAQYGAGSSSAANGTGGGGGGVPVASAPTIINISNNNHNIMAPPFPFHGPPQYQSKMAPGGGAAGAYKEVSKYGAPGGTGTSGTGNGGWSEYATAHQHDANVIGNFEAKNPNKYHHASVAGTGGGARVAGGYRYASEYVPSQQSQAAGMTSHYATGGAGGGYGLYHPDGVQATPIQPQTQPPSAGGTHPSYDPYPHIVRNKYPSGGGQPSHMGATGGSRPAPLASHPDLMYNERSQRYVNSYATGSVYMPSTGAAASTGATAGVHGAFHPQMGPGKAMMNPSMDYYGNSFVKQLSSHHPHHSTPNPYIPPNRMAYASQQSASYLPHPGHHHGVPHPHHKSVVGAYGYASSNGTAAAYDDPYHQRAIGGRVPPPHLYASDAHHQQQGTGAVPYGASAPGSYHHQMQASMGYANSKLTFNKTMNDFYTPNMAQPGGPAHYPAAPPGTTIQSPVMGHYGVKYSAQQMNHGHMQKVNSLPAVTPLGQQQHQQQPLQQHQQGGKPSSSCYYDTPNPVMDVNHPLVDLEEQINSVKILKGPTAATSLNTGGQTGGAPMYDTNHPLNYDCQQMYLKNRYMHSKPMLGPLVPTGVAGNTGYNTGQPIVAAEHHRHQHRHHPHHHHHPETVTAYGGYTTMEDLGLGPRSFALDENLKDKSLRDYLTSWSEMEEEEGSLGSKMSKEANNNQAAHLNYESCKYLNQQTPGDLVESPVPPEVAQKTTGEAVSAAMVTLAAPETPPEAVPLQTPPVASHTGVIVANVQNTVNLPDILVDIEKPAKPEETGKDGEKLYILETYDVPQSELNKYKHLSVINELPKNVVPINDSADSLKFLEEIESNREKYYQTELESEVVYEEKEKDQPQEDVCVEKDEVQAKQKDLIEQQPVVSEPEDEQTVENPDAECQPDAQLAEELQTKPAVCDLPENIPSSEAVVVMSQDASPEDLSMQEPDEKSVHEVPDTVSSENKPVDVDTQLEKPTEQESDQVETTTDEKAFKVPRSFPKYRKRRFYDYDMPRFPKKARRSSIEEFINCDMPKFKVQTCKRSPKSLKSLLLDTINSKPFRRWAKQDWCSRSVVCLESNEKYVAKEAQVQEEQPMEEVMDAEEQLEVNRPVLKECSMPSQEMDHERDVTRTDAVSVVPSLRDLSYERVRSLGLFLQPSALKDLCEKVICVNKHLYIIEEMKSDPPKLQDLCKAILSETNIFIDVTEDDVCIIEDDDTPDVVMESEETCSPNGGRVFIVEENRGSIADLLRDNVELQEEDLVVMRTDSGEECEDHEIFFTNLASEESMVRSLLSDSENDIFSRVEQEIEKMMNTSSSEDEAEVPASLELEEEQRTDEAELFAFAEDAECVQYEEIIPLVENSEELNVNKGILSTLRSKYAACTSSEHTKLRQRLLRKYLIYQRCIQLRHTVLFRRTCPVSNLIAQRKALNEPVKQVPVQPDEDTNCSVSSSSSSSSSGSSSSTHGTSIGSSSSNSSSSSSSSSGSDVEQDDTVELLPTNVSAPEQHPHVDIQFPEANNNKVQHVPAESISEPEMATSLVHDESQPEIAKPTDTVYSPEQNEESRSSCSSNSNGKSSPSSATTPSSSPISTSGRSNRSPSSSSLEHRVVAERPRSVIVSPPVAKRKKKLSFEESLLNIDQMYRKPASPSASSMVPRLVTSANQASIVRPNVIVNVDNKREVARKLIIPSYKIFDQSMDETQLMAVNGHHRKSSPDRGQPASLKEHPKRRTSISAVPTLVRSVSSEAERRSQGLERRRTALMRRRSCCCSPLRSLDGAPSSLLQPTTVELPHLSALPYVRLERNDYVEKLAENYRRQQK